MNLAQRFLLPMLLLAAPALAQLPVAEPPRGWKTDAGQAFPATLLSFDGATATFKMANGSRASAPLAKLSAEDQAYLAEWVKKQPIKTDTPDIVGVDSATLKTEVVSEDPVAEKFVYRTAHFEYESQGKFTQALLKEVGRDFEATYELLKALPWNIDPRPPSGDFFRARLLKDKAAYAAAGGPPGSSGVYKSKTETFLVPFESMGLKPMGKSFTKGRDFDSSTMVHELTHQMMHFWLQLLPQWIVEGTAEYTSNLPLNTGRFRVSAAKTGLKDYVDFLKKRAVGGMPEPFPLEKLFNITNAEWNETLAQDPASSHRLYFTSYLLVYYFMHMDGKGDSQRFLHYFREVQGQRKEMEAYGTAMTEFFKQPGVRRNKDGSYTYSSAVQHPTKPVFMETPAAQEAFQKKALAILLDGRDAAALMKQIRSAYARLGIRL